MQPYYSHSVYATNVIEIADSFSAHSLPPATSMLPIHHAEPFSPESIYKKRKIERACDACRRRKTKCDGPRMPDNVCTNCIQNRKTCSYVFVLTLPFPRAPSRPLQRGLQAQRPSKGVSTCPTSPYETDVPFTATSRAWRTG